MVFEAGGMHHGGYTEMIHLLHEESDAIAIESYIKTKKLTCWRFRLNGSVIIYQEQTEKFSLVEYLKHSNLLWGDSCLYGFYFGNEISDLNHVSQLANTIENSDNSVEATERFAILAYVDGGLISITNHNHHWLNKAQDANWWRSF